MKTIDFLEKFSRKTPNQIVYTSLETQEEKSLTYLELWENTQSGASFLSDKPKGTPVLLLFDNSLEFIQAFLSCQLAGLVPIPAMYPRSKRHFSRLLNVIQDSQTYEVLCVEHDVKRINKALKEFELKVNVSAVSYDTVVSSTLSKDDIGPIAFIQYTSGSTGNPKGAIISHENLADNQLALQEISKSNENSRILTWLPFFHDMGLVGNLLHTIYVGCTSYIMRPVDIISSPVKWLENIDKYKIELSGGPNFVYDLCVDKVTAEQISNLDLSSWRFAYNGAEPVKWNTIQNFTKKFKPYGFNESAFTICYGLAESTLIVSSGIPKIVNGKVSAGKLWKNSKVVLLDASGEEGAKGEVCVSGPSVIEGFWNKVNKGEFVVVNGEKFVRTGDLGELIDDELFIVGRIKEMIIFQGANIFPYDIEESLYREFEQIEPNGVIVFTGDDENEGPIVFAEVKRAYVSSNLKALMSSIVSFIVDYYNVFCADVQVFGPRKLQRTSSGKLQRNLMKQLYQKNETEALASMNSETSNGTDTSTLGLVEKIKNGDYSEESINAYLLRLLSFGMSDSVDLEYIGDKSLFEIGYSSILSSELTNTINSDLELSLDTPTIMKMTTFKEFREYIINCLWLKNSDSFVGNEMEI